jgi:hypothetical protein
MPGYDIGELVAQIAVDTSGMSKGIDSATKQLSSFEGKIDGIAQEIEKSTASMGQSFNQLSTVINGLGRKISGVNSAIRQSSLNVISSLGEMANIGNAQLRGLDIGFRVVREGIDHCVRELRQFNTTLAATSASSSGLKNVGAGFQSFGGFLRRAGGDSDNLFYKLSRLSLAGYIVAQDLRFMGEALTGLFAPGMKFAVEMENAQMGMAAVMTSTLKQTSGEQLEFSDAMGISTMIMKDLRVEALRTTATMEELVTTYQAIIGPGVEKGMDLKQIEDITVVAVNAVKSMGLKKDQLVQEIRAILTGNITARSATIATALGITNTDIDNAKNQVGGVYKFLMDRFKGFQQAVNETENTFNALWTNMEDGIQQTQEKGFANFFAFLKTQLKDVQGLFFNIKRYEEDTVDATGKFHAKGTIKDSSLNPETVALFEKMGSVASQVIYDIRQWATELANNEPFIKSMREHFEAISQVAKALYDNFTLIVKCLFAIWATSGGLGRLILGIATALGDLPEVLNFIADHMQTILILYTTWKVLLEEIMVIFFTQDLSAGILRLQGNTQVLATTFGNLRTQFAAFASALVTGFAEANVASTAFFGSLRAAAAVSLGVIGLVVGAIIALIYYMRKASAEGKQIQNDLANQSGTGQLPDLDQGNGLDDAYKHTEREKGRSSLSNEDLKAIAEQKKQNEDMERLRKMMEGGLTAAYPEEGKTKGAKAAAAEAHREALAEIDSTMHDTVEKLKTYQKELDYQYAENTMNIEDYYRKTVETNHGIIQAEREALEAKLALAEKGSEAVKLQDQINKLQMKQDQQDLDTYRKRMKDYKSFVNEMSGIHKAYLKENKQNDLEGNLTGFYDQYQKQMTAMHNVEKGLTDSINSGTLSESEVATAKKYLDLIARSRRELEKMVQTIVYQGYQQKAQLEIQQAQVERYLPQQRELEFQKNNLYMTELEYKQRVYDLDAQKMKELQPLYEQQIAAMKLLFEKNHDPAILDQIEKLKQSFGDLYHQLSATDQTVFDTFSKGLEDALEKMLDGTKNFRDAWKDMIKQLQKELVFKPVAQEMTNQIRKAMKFPELKSGDKTNALNTPESQKRVNSIMDTMKKIGTDAFNVMDSAAKDLATATGNLIPSINDLGQAIANITGKDFTPYSPKSAPGGAGEADGTKTDQGKVDPNTGKSALAKSSAVQDANTAAVRANTQKFIDSAEQIVGFTGALAVATGNEGLMRLATTIQLIINLIQAMRAVGMFGGTGGNAEGGFISGPGTSTSDSIPTRLSDGEYVVRAASVKRYGVGFMEALNRGRLPIARFAVPFAMC